MFNSRVVVDHCFFLPASSGELVHLNYSSILMAMRVDPVSMDRASFDTVR